LLDASLIPQSGGFLLRYFATMMHEFVVALRVLSRSPCLVLYHAQNK